MTLARRILAIWFSLVALASILYLILPNVGESKTVQLMYALMLLLGLISFYIFRKEPVRKNKPIFLNFSLFFLIGALQFVHLFVGHAFLKEVAFANVHSFQYLVLGLYPFAQAFALVYVVIDSLFREIVTTRKYLLTLVIAGGFFIYYYHPILVDSRYLYQTPDIEDFRTLDRAVAGLSTNDEKFTVADVASVVSLPAWKDGKVVGTLFEDDEMKRIQEILPYLEGSNYVLLVYKPLYLNVVYMNVLCVIFVLLFFGYQYQKDPPQGAYIEKLVFLFLPLASFEALHFFSFMKSIEYETFQHIATLGHYLTFANLIVLGVFFTLRLSFITSVKGEFYERELVLDSEHISRWRDGIDNLVVRHFLNPKTFHGRLFTPREARSKT